MALYNRSFRLGLLVTGAMIGLGSASQAAGNLLGNGSFETVTGTGAGLTTPGYVTYNGGSTAIPSWKVMTRNGNGSDQIALLYSNPPSQPYGFGLSASDGKHFLDLTGTHDNGIFGGVEQTVATTVGEKYLLTFDLGGFDKTPGSLYTAGGIYGITADAGGTLGTFTHTPSVPGTQWKKFSMNFTATSSSTSIKLYGSQAGERRHLGLDNVSLTALTPEMPGGVLLLAALLPLGLMLRKKGAFQKSVL
jgi:hypothetical protein